jgi:uncharacterized membrane protein YfcA
LSNVPAEPRLQLTAGLALGLAVGTASTFLGVSGGELLIPPLVFVFGADIRVAGSATLFVPIPTVCMGLYRYSRMGLFPNRRTLLRLGLPMGRRALSGRRQAAPLPALRRPRRSSCCSD